jgi:predicted ArsR family transcriptional regulator
LTPSQIAKSVGVNYQKALGHLEVLEAKGILTSVKFGVRIRFYKYSDVSPIAHAVRSLIEAFKNNSDYR